MKVNIHEKNELANNLKQHYKILHFSNKFTEEKVKLVVAMSSIQVHRITG